MNIENHLGNLKLLEEYKTAFICSRKIPAGVVLKCYDWAIAQRESGSCIISGFQSPIERDVFHFLLKGKQPIILVLARGLKEKVDHQLQKSIEDGRLLIITPFSKNIKRVTKHTAIIRNKMMIELADSITVGYIQAEGQIEKLLIDIEKPIIKIS